MAMVCGLDLHRRQITFDALEVDSDEEWRGRIWQPATTIDAIAAGADTPLPTLYRLFGSKRALLSAVLDTSFGGDDAPIAFVDRPAVRAALSEPDPEALIDAFAHISRDVMDRSSAILQVLATAASVDVEVSEFLSEIRRQRHTGQSRIVAALVARGALDPSLDESEAADIVYALLSPDMHRILTIERGWSAGRYERWLARSMRGLAQQDPRPRKRSTTTPTRTKPSGTKREEV